MIRTDLDRAIETVNKPTTAEGVLTHIYGETKHINNRPTVAKRSKRVKVKESTIPDDFPEGTTMNKNGILVLPDGRSVRKMEVEDEQIQTA